MADLNNVVTVLEDILAEFRELNSKVSVLEEKVNSIDDNSEKIKIEVQKIDKDMLSMERYLQGLLMKY